MISIPMRYIRAAMAILDMKERREYCRGVWVEFNGAESRIVATCGAVLLVVRFECDVTTDSGTFLVGEELKRINNRAEWLTLEKDGSWVAPSNTGNVGGTARPGVRYPEWRNTLRFCPLHETAQFDPFLLVKLEKAGGAFTLVHNGSGPAVAAFKDRDMFAVISPRCDDYLPPALDDVPDWAHL